jgi:hypothetical protein
MIEKLNTKVEEVVLLAAVRSVSEGGWTNFLKLTGLAKFVTESIVVDTSLVSTS